MLRFALLRTAVALLALVAVGCSHGSGEREGSQVSPDQAWRIAFAKNVYGSGRSVDGLSEIYVANGDGSGQRRLTENDLADSEPRWSPDGSRIAFTRIDRRSGQIFVIDADGSDDRQVTTRGSNGDPVWSPDGTEIAYTSYRHKSRDVYVIPANGGEELRLTNARGYAGNDHPLWSPDGTKIAFESDRDDPFDDTSLWLYVMNADGTHEIRLLRDEVRRWTWSPDGSRIAFVGRDFQIYTVPAEGGDPEQVTKRGAADHTPVWSPDGSQIAFLWSSRYGDREAIHVINPDGTGERKLAAVPFVANAITWSPDGSTVIFGRCFLEGDDACEISAVGADGNGLRTLVRREAHAYDPAVSPGN